MLLSGTRRNGIGVKLGVIYRGVIAKGVNAPGDIYQGVIVPGLMSYIQCNTIKSAVLISAKGQQDIHACNAVVYCVVL